MSAKRSQPYSLDEIRALRASGSLRFGMGMLLLNAAFWFLYYIANGLNEFLFTAITVAACVITYTLFRFVSYQAAAFAFFSLVFFLLVVASLFNPTSPEIPRSQHLFFLPFAIYAYTLFYNQPQWLKWSLSSACILAFLFFALSDFALITQSDLGTPVDMRQYATWFNVIVASATFAGIIHYVHADLDIRDEFLQAMRQDAFEDQLELYYQPQVDREGGIVGAEGLLRWKHPSQGILTPDKFIPYAEKTGMIVDLGRWVLEQACKQLVIWDKTPELQHLRLSINISAREFQEDSFVDAVVERVTQYGIDTSKLKLEITESALVHDIDDVIDKIKQLNAHGIEFSLDDIGTGYSSLSRVRDLPVSEIKIDRSFVLDITSDTMEMPVTDTLLALGESMQVSSVAEGIETKQQWQYLSNKGCEYFQGYYFGKPMDVNMFNQFAYLKAIG